MTIGFSKQCLAYFVILWNYYFIVRCNKRSIFTIAHRSTIFHLRGVGGAVMKFPKVSAIHYQIN